MLLHTWSIQMILYIGIYYFVIKLFRDMHWKHLKKPLRNKILVLDPVLIHHHQKWTLNFQLRIAWHALQGLCKFVVSSSICIAILLTLYLCLKILEASFKTLVWWFRFWSVLMSVHMLPAFFCSMIVQSNMEIVNHSIVNFMEIVNN